jgi:hypothetical protein
MGKRIFEMIHHFTAYTDEKFCDGHDPVADTEISMDQGRKYKRMYLQRFLDKGHEYRWIPRWIRVRCWELSGQTQSAQRETIGWGNVRSLKNGGCNMPLKTQFLHPQLDFFPTKLREVGNEQGVKSKSKLHCDWRSVSLGVEPHLGLMTRYLLLFDNYGLVFVGRPLWREDGSVFYICCWPSPAWSFSGPIPWDSWPYFTDSDLRLPFSSPPTTRRVTVEVFEPASTRVNKV